MLTECADFEDGNHRPDLDGARVVEEFTEVRACDDPGHDSVGLALDIGYMQQYETTQTLGHSQTEDSC